MFRIISDYSVKDTPHHIDKEQIDYGVKMVGAPLEWPETEGDGIKVGIIDTGIDLEHEDLIGRVADYYNFTSSDSKDVTDNNGHGTHVAGIIGANKNNIGVVGVAPKVQLYVAKAFNDDGTAVNGNISQALQWMLYKGVQIVNMSFTTQDYIKEFDYYIKKCYSKGIMCICAAGNSGEGEDTIEYPAKFSETISVTAIDVNKEITDFSSVGQKADIAAPGKDILSTYPNNLYVTLSGTSMAAPLITGSVAILQAKAKNRFNRFLSPSEIKLILSIYTDDLGPKGKDIQYGYGLFSFGRLDKSEYLKTKSDLVGQSIKSSYGKYPINYYPKIINPSLYPNLFYNTLLLKLMGFNI